MNSTRAFALSLSLIVTALTHSAFAKPISISDRSIVRSCDVITPGKLTKTEKAELEAKGYRLKKDRSEYKHERFLGVYEYYTLKSPEKIAGTLYLNAILAPQARQSNSFGPDVSLVSKREFRLMVYTGQFESMLDVVSSTPPRFSPSKAELENADFSALPSCHD